MAFWWCEFMKSETNIILKNFLYFFIKCVIPVLVVYVIHMDIKIFGDVSEKSFVQFGQSIFLFVTSVIFMYLAQKKNADGLWLVAGFLLCMFIREQDGYFDDLYHGSWKYFAITSALFFTWKALCKNKVNAVKTLSAFMHAPAFKTMSVGMMIVLVFSRAFGMRKLWMLIMGDSFNRVVKNVVEEGTELFGYAIIFLATIEYAYALLFSKEDS